MYYKTNLNQILAHQVVKGVKDIYLLARVAFYRGFKLAKLFNWFTYTVQHIKSLWRQQFIRHCSIRPEHQLFIIRSAIQTCGHIRMRYEQPLTG